MTGRHSLQFRLAWRLAVVLVLACTAVVIGFGYFASRRGGPYADQSVDCLIFHFLLDVGWTLPIIILLTLAIGIMAIRQGLQPLSDLSAEIAGMRPGSAPAMLFANDLPSEVAPLVNTLNLTFQRLHKGYEVQRNFTANAAHELRSPLAVLRSQADGLPASQALKLRGDIDRMARVVSQLLVLARVEAGDLGSGAECDLTKLTANVAASLAPAAYAKGVSMAYDAPAESILVQAPFGPVETIIRNLLENAVTHSPHGSQVRICIEKSGRLIVDDEGPGIREEFRERIFDRFWRGNWSAPGGTGLGLSIVKEIAQRIGAEVMVDRSPAEGARFSVSLPPMGLPCVVRGMDQEDQISLAYAGTDMRKISASHR
jgi:signal transduction histidine kinase